jgi:hypothetical protein
MISWNDSIDLGAHEKMLRMLQLNIVVKYVHMSRLLYSHIFKYTVLYFNKQIYCTVLQQLSSQYTI